VEVLADQPLPFVRISGFLPPPLKSRYRHAEDSMPPPSARAPVSASARAPRCRARLGLRGRAGRIEPGASEPPRPAARVAARSALCAPLRVKAVPVRPAASGRGARAPGHVLTAVAHRHDAAAAPTSSRLPLQAQTAQPRYARAVA
jgi:hypothetical protein